MSKVVWKQFLAPDMNSAPTVLQSESYNEIIENVRHYPVASDQIAIPDPKAFRSMSRTAVMIANLCMQAKETLAKYQSESPFAVGIYCAVENGPIDAPSTVKIISQPDQSKFADYYRKFRNPKLYLKQLPNLIPAQMGIFMGLQGLMNVYTHSTMGSVHALEQAEWDLKTGVVKAALVCTAHAYDDFMVMKRTRHYDIRCINEGACAMILENNGEFTDWSKKISQDKNNSFGISDQLMQIAMKS